MKALKFDNGISLTEIPKPTRKDGESTVKVLMAGICNTDLEIVQGYMGFKGILGHEFVGVVEESQNHSLLNKRVTGEINIGCGHCEFCLSGTSRHCSDRSVVGIFNKQGVFAQYITLPDSNLHIIPDSMPNKYAVFVEPVAAAVEILEQVKILPDMDVAIIGDGKLALLIVQVLQLTGCRCILFGKHENKMKIAQNLGAVTFSVKEKVKQKFNLVIEASGNKDGLLFALNITKPRGQIVLKSTYHSKITMNFAEFVINEINLIGSRCGLFAPAIRLLEQNYFKLDPLIDKIFPFDDIVNAFTFAQNGSLKVLVDFK